MISAWPRHGRSSGAFRFWLGNGAGSLEAIERGHAHAERAGSERLKRLTTNELLGPFVWGPVPAEEVVDGRPRSSLRSRRRGAPRIVLDQSLAVALRDAGRDRPRGCAVRDGRDARNASSGSGCISRRAHAYLEAGLMLGRYAETERVARDGIEQLRGMGEHGYLSTSLIYLADAIVSQGRPDEARDAAERGRGARGGGRCRDRDRDPPQPCQDRSSAGTPGRSRAARAGCGRGRGARPTTSMRRRCHIGSWGRSCSLKERTRRRARAAPRRAGALRTQGGPRPSGRAQGSHRRGRGSLIGSAARLVRLLPDRDVLAAVARERLALPAAPALAQPHPGELRHQVVLGRPRVAERHRETSTLPSDDLEVMRDQPLVRDVVLVDPPVRLAAVEDVEGLAGRKPPELRDHDLDDEAAAGLEVRRRIAEARDLRRLRRQVHDRVEDQVHERERPVDRRSSRSRRS